MDEPSVKLIAQWQKGDQAAAAQLFERYSQRLVALARSRLSLKLAQRLDPEDVVQSVYRSFFAGARAGQYEIQQSGALWKLLASITLNKLHNQVRRHSAEKRAVTAEQRLGAEDSMHDIPAELCAHEPSPAEALALVDELEQLMRRLGPVKQRMLELRLSGCTLAEIAVRTQRSQCTVRRVMDEVKLYLARINGSEESPANP